MATHLKDCPTENDLAQLEPYRRLKAQPNSVCHWGYSFSRCPAHFSPVKGPTRSWSHTGAFFYLSHGPSEHPLLHPALSHAGLMGEWPSWSWEWCSLLLHFHFTFVTDRPALELELKDFSVWSHWCWNKILELLQDVCHKAQTNLPLLFAALGFLSPALVQSTAVGISAHLETRASLLTWWRLSLIVLGGKKCCWHVPVEGMIVYTGYTGLPCPE